MEFKFREKFKDLSQFRPPLNYELVGKKLEVTLDGFGECRFEYLTEDTLYLDCGDIHQKNYYETVKADNHVYLTHFEIDNQKPRHSLSLVYDAETGQLTVVFAIQGNEAGDNPAVTHEILFGAVKQPDGTYPAGRASYTEDLIGKALDFTYSSDFTWRHTYLEPHRYRWQLTSAGVFEK